MQSFLFTDIEGSTRLWERHPAAMGQAVARQEQLLREAIGLCGGTVFNTAGDSVCAVFPEPERAIAAAIDGQRRLLAEPWAGYAPGLTISVRMAVDAGDVQTSGSNFVGPVLNRLHRLMKTGHGGQILCTEAVSPALEGHSEITLHDLGAYSLRDLPEETRIFQLIAPGLPGAFPPLVTDRPSAPNLPALPSALIGRDGELGHLTELVRDPKVRLLTLIGPGGVGKTTLALALARQLYRAFANGACFVDLSAVREPALVAPTIATVAETADPLLSQEDALIAQLGQRTMLLVLDNCEHVAVETARIVARLLSSAATVTVLATSRVPLRIRGEWEAHVLPLPLPASNDDPSTSPAVQLFAEHARQVENRFALDDRTAPAVADICRMVDGLPLAIELAAAWVRVLDPDTLRDRLAEGAPLLRSDTRDRPERHRTLTSTIDWSYQLLSSDAQWAFGRLAVFQGGIPFDAAMAVLQDGNRFDFVEALALLDELIQANLLQSPAHTPDGPRYGMLQTIREFGLTTLAGGETIATHRAHANVFAAMVQAAEQHYRDLTAPIWLKRLDENIENVRAAITWLATGTDLEPDREAALRITIALWRYFDIRGRHPEAHELVSSSLEHATNAPPLLKSQALTVLGHTGLANYEQAETFYRRSIDEHLASQPSDLPYGAMFGLCTLAQVRGDYPTAIDLAQQMVDAARASGMATSIAEWLLMLGQLKSESRQFAEATRLLEESLQIAEESGNAYFSCWIWKTLGEMHLWQDNLEIAEPLYTQAFAAFESMKDPLVMAQCQLDLAWIAARRGDPPIALSLLHSAVEEIAQNGNPFLTHEAITTGAMILMATETEVALALSLLESADHWLASTGSVLNPLRTPWMVELRNASQDKRPEIEWDRMGPDMHATSLREAIDLLRSRLHNESDNPSSIAQDIERVDFELTR